MMVEGRTHPGVSPQRTGVFFIRLLNSTTSSMTSGEVSLVETISTCPNRARENMKVSSAGPDEQGQEGEGPPHQAHGRDRVEVVQGEEALLALVRDEFGNLAHAETARVAREDGVRRSDPVEPLEQVLLRLEVLDDRFDDQVGRGGGFLGRSGRRDVGKDAVDVVLLGGGVVGRFLARDASQGLVDDGASFVGKQNSPFRQRSLCLDEAAAVPRPSRHQFPSARRGSPVPFWRSNRVRERE